MSDQTSRISVIICAYTDDRWDEILAAIKSVQHQSIPVYEIIVVVDHNMALLERLKTQALDVIIIENRRKKGLSGARNSGIAIARGELIAFLDDDAIAEPTWLERLHDGCRDPRVLGTGGFVDPLWVGKRPGWFPHEFYWVVGCSYQTHLNAITEVRNPYGGCTCMRREIFETIGGFHEGIGRIGKHPLGGEETELSIRARQHWPEKVFLCDPQARIRHHISPARARWSYFVARCYSEGISKAMITYLVGSKDTLASERSYTILTLPKGVARGLRDGFLRGDPTGFQRAGAIIAGLFTTAAGYFIGCMHRYHMTRQEKALFNAVYELNESLRLKD